MSYGAVVYRVLVASPSDVEERNLIRDIIYDWNIDYSCEKNIVLLPVLWETHVVPEMGGAPQDIVNKQIVENSDILVGVFWTKLGTPTEHAESGTVEEIKHFLEKGRPVLIYFSNKPVAPREIDSNQLEKLNAFKEFCKTRGIIGDYDSAEGLKSKLTRGLLEKVRQLGEGSTTEAVPAIAEKDIGGFYRGMLTEWAKRADLDNWKTWTSNLLCPDPSIKKKRVDQLQSLVEWLLSRPYPGQFPELEDALRNFYLVLHDLLEIFLKHAKPKDDRLVADRFYKLDKWDEDLHRRLIKEYEDHISLLKELVLELTRAANWVSEKARRLLDSDFRLMEGVLLVQESDGISVRTMRPEYNKDERLPIPYPGLEEFKKVVLESR